MIFNQYTGHTEEDRLLALTLKTDGCWLWQGTLSKDGYGRLRRDGRANYKAHRLSWEIYRGLIPVGALVLHKCDVPGCVNPDHLFLGTQKDNIVDKVTKQRQARGPQHGMAKLTASGVCEIRELGRNAAIQRIDIARCFNISPATVSDVILGKSWRHLQVTP